MIENFNDFARAVCHPLPHGPTLGGNIRIAPPNGSNLLAIGSANLDCARYSLLSFNAY